MQRFSEDAIYQVLCLVKNSIVFLDSASAECFHWSNGFMKLLDAGALNIRDIHHTKECLESESKCVFIISTPLTGQVLKYIQRIIKNSDFDHCIIVTSISSNVNDFIANQTNVFQHVTQQIKTWMQNEFASVAIEYIPLVAINITSKLFIMPTHNNFFPVLPSDVARLQAFLHSQGDKRVFNSLGDVDMAFLPQKMQASIKSFCSSMNSMFEQMDIHKDCYAVGHFSRLVANELANMTDAKGRRKVASSRASIVFIDRTVDLVAPMSHTSDSVLGSIYEILPPLKNHNNDVEVNMVDLFANGNVNGVTLFPGCLSHHGDEEVQKLIQMFIMKTKKDCLQFINKKLEQIMIEEKLQAKDEIDPEILQIEKLKKSIILFKNNINMMTKHGGFLQCVMAFLNTITHEENDHIDEILSAEKIIMQDLMDDDKDPFSQVHRLLSDKDNKKFSVVDALVLCLLIYSGGQEISNATPAQEEKLKECLINVLMDGHHREDLLFLIGDLDASERQIRTRIADIFERLRGVGESRENMQVLKDLLHKDEYGMVRYEPILQQVVERIFSKDKPELTDIEFRSHGLRDFLKTGFGFFMNVSKPRPDDHPLVVLFVIGGITWYEIQSIEKNLKKINPTTKVLIGSTRIITPSDTLEQVLCSENLFVDVDT